MKIYILYAIECYCGGQGKLQFFNVGKSSNSQVSLPVIEHPAARLAAPETISVAGRSSRLGHRKIIIFTAGQDAGTRVVK